MGDLVDEKNAPSARADAILIIFVLAASLIFFVEQLYISRVNGWWYDELFSLLVTNPALSFADNFAKFAGDSMPPLYLSALYGMRNLISDDRSAVFALNMVGFAACAIAVIIASRKAGMLTFGLVSIIVFLLSGPVLRFTLEARVYLWALALGFVATWFCALAVEAPQRRPGLASFAFLGVVAALLHVYAALLCGALAAAVLVLALVQRRRDLAAPGFVLGISASLVLLLWLTALLEWAPKAMTNLDWIIFTWQTVLDAFKRVIRTALGDSRLSVPLLALIVFGLIRSNTRSITMMISLANAIFIIVPLVVSIIKEPIILDRYWLIGAPSLIVLMIFLTRAWLKEGLSVPRRPVPLLATGAALTLLFASDALGFGAARFFVASKLIWRGGALIAPLVQHCPAGSVHVVESFNPTGLSAYAYIARAPQALFVDAAKASTTHLRVADTNCPILGWSEHVPDTLHATDEEMLRFLKIDASPAEVQIYRDFTSYVVAKPGTLGSIRSFAERPSASTRGHE